MSIESSDKALAACKEYDRLMLAIKRNTNEIGEGTGACDRIFEGPEGGYIPDGKQTHLSEAFEPYECDDEYFPAKHWNDENEALEIIGDCAGCLKAYKAVQERKSNKKKLGAIKRSIRMIGRAA